jgi:hypothetical protein
MEAKRVILLHICGSQEGNSPPYLWKPGWGKNIRKAIMGDS